MSVLRKSLLGVVLLALAFVLVPAAGASPALDASVWSGEYYNNMTVSGPPVYLRGDSDINFFWAEGTSPIPGWVNTSQYSVRWTRSVYFDTTGNWVFTTVNDDGMRVWVDGNITMDAWYDQGPTTHNGTIYLTAGWHTVKVEYYNNGLGGTARVSYALQGATPGTYPDWKGEYYNNPWLSGSPAVTRNDVGINFNWAYGSPDPAIPADNFSVRWSRDIYLTAGTWRFTTVADDGVRLWIDGSLIIDKWFPQGATTYTADINATGGVHSAKLEYFEAGGVASVMLSYAPISAPPPSAGVWRGQYWNNISFSGSPALVRDDASLHFIWNTNSPGWPIPADNFSAKWDSVQTVPTTGNYTVLVSSDDGVRVWIDGVIAVDAWYDHAPALFSTTRYLTAGAHNVHVEYYERTGGAMVGVDILPVGSPPPPPPPPPGGDVIVDDRGSGWQAGGISTQWRNLASGYGGHAFWTYNNAYAQTSYNWARWYPMLPAADNYEVFAYIPAGVSSTTNARYWVYHNGRYDLAVRAQAFYPNQWVSLGTYYFSGTGGEFVSLSDVTYECYLCRTIAFDAVKFSPR